MKKELKISGGNKIAESEHLSQKIQKLQNSRDMIAQINRKLAHSVLLPLNSTCLIPSKIIETNRVKPRNLGTKRESNFKLTRRFS